MNCGHCHNHHDTVAEVKACYNTGPLTAALPLTEGGTTRALATPAPVATMEPAFPAVQPGYFTIVEGDSRITIRLVPHWVEAEAKDTLVLGYLRGADNTSDYTNVAFVKRDGRVIFWKRYRNTVIEGRMNRAMDAMKADPAKATDAYVLQSGNCWMCGRLLTVPSSIYNGRGPVCAKKAAW